MLRIIRYAAIALIAVLAAVWGAWWLRDGGAGRLGLDNVGLTIPGGVSLGGPFALVDTTGAPVTDASYRGRWMLIYFGFTSCPDVCPTELQTVSAALDRLGPLATKIAPIFITIDPERDTPAALAEYVKLFDDRLIGLSGTPDQIAAAARAYRVYFARAKSKDASSYLMDHSSFVYLVGPDGTFRALFRQGMTVDEMAEALKSRLSGGG